MDRTKRNVAALGALTILGIIVFFWGLYFLLGSTIGRGGMDVVALMPTGGGLKRGNPVSFQGVQLGTVRDIELVPNRGVAVMLRMNQRVPLSADTRAIVYGDVFGAHSIEIVPGKAAVKLEKGDTIMGEVAPALADAAVGLTGTARSVLQRADSILSYEAIENIHATARSLPGSAEQLRAALIELRQAAAVLRSTAQEVRDARTGAALNAALTRIDEGAREISTGARTITTAAATLNTSIVSLQSVLAKVDRGEGTLGRLVNDTSLYAQLNGAAREFRALAVDIRANPRRYVDLKIF